MLFDVVRDLRIALNKSLYDELVENSFYYAPPYLPLSGYMIQSKNWPMLSLAVMEWENLEVKKEFADYFERNYPSHDLNEATEQINKWLTYLRSTNA